MEKKPAELLEKLSQLMTPKVTSLVRLSSTNHCPRAVVMSTMTSALEVSQDPASVGVIELGTAWHNRLQEYLHKLGLVTESDVVLEVKNKVIRGHMDAYDPTNRILYEFKTVSKTAQPYLPKRENVAQAVAYALSEPQNPIVKAAYPPKELVIIYFFREDPNPLRARAFTFEFPDEVAELVDEVKRYWENVIAYIEKGEIPPVPAGYSPQLYPCRWRTEYGLDVRCPFFELCWTFAEQQVDKEAITSQFLAIADEREKLQHMLNHVDAEYKRLLNELTKDIEGDTYELSKDAILVRVRRKDIWTAKVVELLGDATPYKETEFWRLKRL
ncbi:MAG: hypothetical protein QXT10_04620 [Candidatus Bathyarchaeia archaeon]